MPIFLDTETTGQMYKQASATMPYQPDVVQLAFIVDDDAGNTVATHSMLVQPRKGNAVQEGARQVHGISTEAANSHGLPMSQALRILGRYLTQAPHIVAHNAEFDTSMLETMQHRSGIKLPTYDVTCTMLQSRDRCRLEPVRKSSQYKFPKLEEAYAILVNVSGFSGAHDALADVRACRELYYAL